MVTTTNAPASWISVNSDQKQPFNLWHKWLAVADGQAKYQAVWFVFSLIFMGVLCLPLPALLIYSYNAPIVVLVISMTLFFSNYISCMAGSGIRTTLTTFAVSMIIYILIATLFLL